MKTTIDGIDIHYSVSGDGRDVLLLHGWGASLNSFAFVQQALEKDFRVFSLDFPGFGQSGEPPVPWGVEEYAGFVKKFIAELGIGAPIIIGHSHGGRTAIRYAAENPVHKLVLVDSAGIKPKRSAKYYIRVYTYKAVKRILGLPGLRIFRERVLERFRSKVGSDDYRNASPIMRQTLVKLVNTDLKEYLPRLQAPTLLVWGENDTDTPLSHGRLMEEKIPNAGLVVMKNAGHWAYAQKPREFLIVLNSYLESDKKQGGA